MNYMSLIVCFDINIRPANNNPLRRIPDSLFYSSYALLFVEYSSRHFRSSMKHVASVISVQELRNSTRRIFRRFARLSLCPPCPSFFLRLLSSYFASFICSENSSASMFSYFAYHKNGSFAEKENNGWQRRTSRDRAREIRRYVTHVPSSVNQSRVLGFSQNI